VTRVRELEPEARVAELAAMLAGDGTASAMDTARELLERARASHAPAAA
jgi:DNA repair ATPase RecN